MYIVKLRSKSAFTTDKYTSLTLYSSVLRNMQKTPLKFFKVWDLVEGNEINGIDSEGNEFNGIEPQIVRFSSDGTQVIIGCKVDRVFIWHWQNRDVPLKSVILPAFSTIELACDGNIIYTCSKYVAICKIDLGSLIVLTIRQGPKANCTPAVVLPDGKAILSGITTDSLFIYWELSTMHEIEYIAGR